MVAEKRVFYNKQKANINQDNHLTDDISEIDSSNFLYGCYIINARKGKISSNKLIGLFKRLDELKQAMAITKEEDEILNQNPEVVLLREQLFSLNSNAIKLIDIILERIKIDTRKKYEYSNISVSLEIVLKKLNITKKEFLFAIAEYQKSASLKKTILQKKHELRKNDKILKKQQEYENICNEIIENNARLIKWIIWHYFKYAPIDMEEAEGYALEGLASAINTYDYRLGNAFSTYATPVIIRNIRAHLKDLCGMDWRNYDKSRKFEMLVLDYQRVNPKCNIVTAKEIFESGLTDISYEDLCKMEFMFRIKVLLDTYYHPKDPINTRTYRNEMLSTFEDYEEYDQYEDTISAEDLREYVDPYEEIFKEALVDEVAKALSHLTKQEQKVISLRFGLNGEYTLILKEVGKVLGVTTKERPRQIEAKALWKLRHNSYSRWLKEFYDGVVKDRDIDQIIIYPDWINSIENKDYKIIAKMMYDLYNTDFDVFGSGVDQFCDRYLDDLSSDEERFATDQRDKYSSFMEKLPKGIEYKNIYEYSESMNKTLKVSMPIEFYKLYNRNNNVKYKKG